MDIEEAIGRTELGIIELTEMKRNKEIVRDTIGEDHEDLLSTIEALSVVLKSAKLLHSSETVMEYKQHPLNKGYYTHLFLEKVLSEQEAKSIGIYGKQRMKITVELEHLEMAIPGHVNVASTVLEEIFPYSDNSKRINVCIDKTITKFIDLSGVVDYRAWVDGVLFREYKE